MVSLSGLLPRHLSCSLYSTCIRSSVQTSIRRERFASTALWLPESGLVSGDLSPKDEHQTNGSGFHSDEVTFQFLGVPSPLKIKLRSPLANLLYTFFTPLSMPFARILETLIYNHLMAFRRSFLISFLSFFSLFAAFSAGFFGHAYFESSSDFPILRQAYKIIEKHGLKELPLPPAIEYGMIRGMLDAYADPNSTFLEPVEQMIQTDSLQGSVEGIGVDLQRDEAGNITLYPKAEGPAARAGVKDGDRLVRIGDRNVTPETDMETVQEALRGPEGHRVSLELLRPPSLSRIFVEIRLESIPLPSTTWYVSSEDPRVGVIKISLIALSTPEEVVGAVDSLQNQGVSLFILDLRDNGGGLLTSGVDTARLFLKEGVILQQQYRENEIETFSIERPGPLVDLPVVILVNGGTASAAEILAGSLQSHGRALLVGSSTYGKNSIQLVFDLQDGSSLHVTAARWWLPGQEMSALEKGLQPDIDVPTPTSEADPALSTAIQVLLSQE